MRKILTESREDWLKERKKGIGGSDIAGVCGLSNFASPLSIYLDKKDLIPKTEEENIAMELGLELEPFLSRKFVKYMKEKEGLDVELKEMPCILQHDKIDYFMVNLDRYFNHPQKGECAVELKTTTEFRRNKWKDDEVPDEYYMQVQWQLMITGWNYCYLAFLIGNRTFDVKIIKRNDKAIETMIERGKVFWEEFIEKDQPPAPIGLKSDEEALKVLYPEESPGSEKILTPGEEEEIVKYLDIIKIEKVIADISKKKIDTAKQNIKLKIGKNEYMVAGDKKITYRLIKIPSRVTKEYTYRRISIKNLSKEVK